MLKVFLHRIYLLYNKIKKMTNNYDNKYMFTKKIMIFLFLISSLSSYASFRVQIIHRNRYHFLNVYDTVPIRLEEEFSLLENVDRTQIHRIMLNNIEKSRLNSLLFVGDSYSFNNMGIKKISPFMYRATDLAGEYSIDFSLGKYDDIIIHSYVNFYNRRWESYKEVDEYDKIASGMAVKMILDRLVGSITNKSDLPLILTELDIANIKFELDNDRDFRIIERSYTRRNDREFYLRQDLTGAEEFQLRKSFDKVGFKYSRSLESKDKMDAYYEFVNQLKLYDTPEKIFDKLSHFVTINFKIIDDLSVDGSWTNPYEVFHSKRGDYKSIAFFYYYTFNRLDIDCQGYFVTPLTRKTVPDNNRYTMEQQNAVLVRNRISLSSNLDIRKFNMPDFRKSVFLITVKYNGKWIYTTGRNWIKTDILDRDRVAAHYSRNGCYYAVFREALLVMENIPINPDRLRWEVFYDVTRFVE